MGTSIDCFFAREADRHPAAIQARLNELSHVHRDDLRILSEKGWFSAWLGDWSLRRYVCDGDPDSLAGEGPANLRIYVHRRVVILGCLERFSAFYNDRLGVGPTIRRLLIAFAAGLSTSDRMAVATGGGDTDGAHDLAYYSGGSFDDMVACHTEVAGPPADTWDELALGEKSWHLGAIRDLR